ncbi:hypothetical protein [Marivita sp.]|uniref:hypothetical protein n=1 Tax=Marivita sp. TaxID=2003365 RepID=UPI003F6ED9A7
MKQLFTVVPFILLPFAVQAETQLERLEDVSERMNSAVMEMMVREVERQGGNPEPLRGAIPDGEWNDAYRDAGQCMLDRYTEASSQSDVDEMITKMEGMIPMMATANMEDLGDNMDITPEGISDELSMQINNDCGMTDLMLERMQESGFTEALMQSMSAN